jgi:hypothetical protein
MSLTLEQIDEMVTLSAPLVENPLPWSDLSPEQQTAFRLLMPDPSFTNEQRFWLGQWVLAVTPEQVEAINALMPPNNVVSARESVDGALYVGADLLSDALDGRRLAALLPTLETLPLTFAETIAWPVVVDIQN